MTLLLMGTFFWGARGVLGQTLLPDSLYREFAVLTCDSKLGKINSHDIAVHRDGRVLIAAKQGIAIYDGERWELVRHPEDQIGTSVAVDPHGRILVGFHADFGVLSRRADGSYEIESLAGKFQANSPSQVSCKRILACGGKVFFGCSQGLAVWTPDAREAFQYVPLTVGLEANSFWTADDQLFMAGQFASNDLQFLKYEDRDLKVHAQIGHQERPKAYIVGGCEYASGEQLIGTFNEGLYLLSEKGLRPFLGEASELARQIFVKGVLRCDDGTFTIAGERGVIFADPQGRILEFLRSTEIEEIGICRNAPYLDHEKQLWIPTRGLGHAICFDTTAKLYRWKTKILGPTWAYDGSMGRWIGGTGPIRYFLQKEETTDFDATQSLDILEADDELLISSSQGLKIASVGAKSAVSDVPSAETETSAKAMGNVPSLTPVDSVGTGRFLTMGQWLPGKSNALFATLGDGIHWYHRSEDTWRFGGHLIDSPVECFDMEWEPQHQQLWFTHRERASHWRLSRLQLDPNHLPDSQSELQEYDLLTSFDKSLALWRGKLLFLTINGLQVYDPDSNRFSKLDLPFQTSEHSGSIEAFEVDSDEQLWVYLAGEGLYRIDGNGEIEFAYPTMVGVYRIQCPENADHLFLFSYENGAVKLPRHRRSDAMEMPKLNRLVASSFPKSHSSWTNSGRDRSSGFLIEYSARGHSLHPTAKYQYRIVGWNSEWSSWSNENRIALQSLPPGSYDFEVRCQSRWLRPGPVQSIPLFVPTPWYSRWWAQSLAGMLMVGGMSAMVSWRIRAERRRANQLEKKVRERTSELSQAKHELEDRVRSRTQDLEFANQKLREEIGQRHQVEVYLHDSEERYRTIVEGQSDMIVRFDRSGAITFANQAYCRHFVGEGLAVVGSPFAHGMDASISQTLESWIESPESIHTPITFRHSISRNGETVWEDWKIHALQDASGKIVGFQGLGRDVSTLVKTQEDLRLKEEYLRHGSRLSMLGEMVASITHELRQPLGSISNFAFASEQSLVGVDTERARQLAKWNQQIVEQIARADSIVRRLRGFARRADAELELCDVNQVINDALAMLQFELRRAEVETDCQLGTGLRSIPFARVQLEQVLVNLIRNACDAMLSLPSSQRRLTISTSGIGNQVCVRVSDSGPGVPDVQRAQIFEPFHTTKPDGLGLGLAISRSIVEDGGGKIWLESSQQGATFAFTLTDDPHAE